MSKTRILSRIVMLTFMLFVIGIGTSSVDNATAKEMETLTDTKKYVCDFEKKTVEFNTINPVYRNIKYEPQLKRKSRTYKSESAYFTDEKKAISYLKDEMVKRSSNICFVLEQDLEDAKPINLDDYINEIYDNSTGSCEGDYLRYTVYQWKGKVTADDTLVDGKVVFNISCDITYYTTKEQEDDLTAQLETLKKQIITDEMSDYEKTKAIFDYIVKNVKYDTAGLNDDDDVLKYTAYGAIVEKSAVCQGYAVVLQRLLKEEGIESQIITSDAMEHAWNTVQLNGLYYYADSTWDSNTYESSGEVKYLYFLKGKNDFLSHDASDTQYSKVYYSTIYPLAENAYNVSNPEQKKEESGLVDFGQYGDNVIWKYYDNGKLQLVGYGSTWDARDDDRRFNYHTIPWKQYEDSIKAVEIEEGITTVGAGIFANHKKIETVSFPNSLIMIDSFAFMGCESIKEIHLPENLRLLRQEAFAGCSLITEVVIPGRVTYLDSGIFNDCSELRSIYIDWDDDFEYTSYIYEMGPISRRCYKLEKIDVAKAHPYIYENKGVLFGRNKTDGDVLKDYSGTITKSFCIGKGDQSISVKKTSYSYKKKKLKKNTTIKLNAKSSRGVILSYKVKSGNKKFISVKKNGTVTLKKKAPKGTYKIVIMANETVNVKKAMKTITIKVK